MSSRGSSKVNVTPEELFCRLSKVSDATQLAEGFQERPQLVFDAFQTLMQRNMMLESTPNELTISQQRIKELENATSTKAAKQRPDSSNNVMSRLTDLLQPRAHKTMLIADCEQFSGKKGEYYAWKESILLKLNTNADHFPTENSRIAYICSQMKLKSREHLNSLIRNGTVLFELVS
ncbi:unnamed protein product [Blumeria hordei]|uniref:Uncharacterized protein n=1 Tax=Blumeria hordei TaxID=2867405 RepID=A0A383V1B8_BLUHO|nr:unnamed protein product [Blumeria hordei]